MIKRLVLVMTLLLVSFSVISCASIPKLVRARKIVDPGEDVLKQHTEEVSRLYGKLKIRSLDEIGESEFADYKQYELNGTAYVIVHPSYYLFFHDNNDKKIVVERQSGDFSKNIVDIFIESYPVGNSKVLKQMRASERRERDFIKKIASSEKLMFLVLPPDYLNHPEYPYRRLDEYARYLNEVTGGSPSVIYVESESHKRGRMNPEVLARLLKLFDATGINTLLLGGGYKDLCLKDFQEDVQRIQEIESVEILSEICTDSPDFISDDK